MPTERKVHLFHLIVEPMPRPSLLKLLSTWEPLEEDLPAIDDLGRVEEVDL